MDIEIPQAQRRKENRKRLLRYALVLTASIAAFLLILSFMRSSISYAKLNTSKVDVGTIEVSISASGKVIPLYEEVIVSPISSRILEVYKNPGDRLEKGDPILKLELATVETDYRQKLDEREMKKSRLVQSNVNLSNRISDLRMQQQIKDMQVKKLATELKNERYLDSIGASTQDRIRQIELNYEVAKLELEQLKTQVVNEQKSADAERKVQELDLSIFEKTLLESQRLLNDARILSPQAATLTFINNQIGAQVQAGSQIAILSDLSAFKVDAEIADGYADRLSLGAKAIVKLGELQLEGTVVNITPSVKNGIINFSVMLKEASHSKLRSGLKTDVYVMNEIREEVKRIRNASYYIGKGSYDLWVISGGEAAKRNVQLGESNFEYVEVIGGLEVGDELIISDMAQHQNKKSLKIKR